MKKHLIVIGTAVLLLAVGLSGCTDTDETSSSKIVNYSLLGKWEVESSNLNERYDFKPSVFDIWIYSETIGENKITCEYTQDESWDGYSGSITYRVIADTYLDISTIEVEEVTIQYRFIDRNTLELVYPSDGNIKILHKVS